MKVIVTHHSPDLDGITSIWLIKKFLPGWNQAKIKFVPAGEKLEEKEALRSAQKFSRSAVGVNKFLKKGQNANSENFVPPRAITSINNDEIIHVDTGLGALDHHQIPAENVSAASLTWEFIKAKSSEFPACGGTGGVRSSQRVRDKMTAIERIIKVVTSIDHFKEVFWSEPLADYHEFSLLGIFEGLKKEFPKKENLQITFIIKCLDSLLHRFEDRVWAEKEIKKGIGFRVKGGRGIAFETVNDTVLPLAQKMGFSLVVRKDPRKGYVRIKARPKVPGQKEIDLTPAYKKLKKLDPGATWFLHISKKMLLNGTSKSAKMKSTKLSLEEIIEVLKN